MVSDTIKVYSDTKNATTTFYVHYPGNRIENIKSMRCTSFNISHLHKFNQQNLMQSLSWVYFFPYYFIESLKLPITTEIHTMSLLSSM